jgi:hypothetical protein
MDPSSEVTEGDKHVYLLGYLVYLVVASAVTTMLLQQLSTRQRAKANTNAVPVRQ